MSFYFRRRFHFEKKDWNEADHPRGKTTPESTDGSFAPKGGASAGGATDKDTAKVEPIHRPYPADSYDPAADAQVQASATPAQMLRDQFGPTLDEQGVKDYLRSRVSPGEWAAFVAASEASEAAIAAAGGDTQTQHATVTKTADGKEIIDYDVERRAAVHAAVVNDYITRYEAAAAKFTGDQPELVVLAGRGGSGKSGFGYTRDGEVTSRYMGFYSRDSVVINPDDIKEHLYAQSVRSGKYPKDVAFDPTKDGAGYWHEESSYVTKLIQAKILALAEQGVRADVVFDLTLASNKGEQMGEWRDAGFTTTLAGINIPKQESAFSALYRYLGDPGKPRGRLVPIRVIANSARNEINFDTMIGMKSEKGNPAVDRWYIYTRRETQPMHLVAQGGAERKRGTK